MPDGKILAGGNFENYGPPRVAGFIAVRFLPDGTLDPAFGDAGSGAGRITLPSPNSNMQATAMQVQSDGRTILAGYRISPGYRVALGRFTPDGTADQSFGTGGAVYSTFTGVYNWFFGLALLPDQKLLAAGAVQYSADSGLKDILLARYHVPPPTPLQIWRVTWFGSPADSGPGADENDCEHDGLPNFMEYATLSHPLEFTANPCRPAGEGRFTYSRPAAALTEFSYIPESAPSPGGPWSSSGLTSSVLTDDRTVQTIEVAPSSPSSRLFLRLRVTKL